MAFKTADGGHKSSKFRAARADREHATMREPGERAQANKIEAKTGGEHEAAEEQAEERADPGIHDEIKQIAAEHGPAHTIHIVHDHEAKKSHVHSVHADGHEHHADHDGEQHVKHAHEHAMHAAGVAPESEGEYPEGHETAMGGEEQYGEPL